MHLYCGLLFIKCFFFFFNVSPYERPLPWGYCTVSSSEMCHVNSRGRLCHRVLPLIFSPSCSQLCINTIWQWRENWANGEAGEKWRGGGGRGILPLCCLINHANQWRRVRSPLTSLRKRGKKKTPQAALVKTGGAGVADGSQKKKKTANTGERHLCWCWWWWDVNRRTPLFAPAAQKQPLADGVDRRASCLARAWAATIWDVDHARDRRCYF